MDKQKMDCNELKQRIMADPHAAFDDEELAQCEDCRALLEEMRALDAQLKQAMAIDVPPLSMPELPAIDTDKVVGLPTRRRVAKAPVWLATAAAVTSAQLMPTGSCVVLTPPNSSMSGSSTRNGPIPTASAR